MLPIGQVKHINIYELLVQLAKCSLPEFNGFYLALAESTLGAMFDPRGASEANHIHLIQASFGDVIADGVGLARVGDTAWAALILWEHTEFTLHLWTRQGPTVNFPLLQGKQMCKGRGRGRESVEGREEGGSTVFTAHSIYYTQTFKAMNLAGHLQKPYLSNEVYTEAGF